MDKMSWVSLRDETLTQCLLKAARLYNEKSIELIREKYDMPNLRVSHTTLMPHIDFEGTRQTVIAQRMGVSKQAVGQLINEMIEMGSLKLEPDPEDGRAKLVKFNFENSITPSAALEVAGVMEEQIEIKIGKKKTTQLKKLLREILEVFDEAT